jgi:hypothetical protein
VKTTVVETQPYINTTRTTFTLANGQVVEVDVDPYRTNGTVTLYDVGGLNLLNFEHRNPMGAARTLVATISNALAATVEA